MSPGPTIAPTPAEDLVATVVFAAEQLDRCREADGAAKWAVVGLHALLQTACLAALSSEAAVSRGDGRIGGRGVFGREPREGREEARDGPRRIAGFDALFRRVCSTLEMRASPPLAPSPEDVARIEALAELRNRVVHRPPADWNLTHGQLAAAAVAVGHAVAHLALDGTALARHLDPHGRAAIAAGLARIAKAAAALRQRSSEMSETTVLYGFDGSTYVRSVRMMLAEKGVAYDHVPVNVLTGETRTEEHLARHPFGKVPVLDIDGMRLMQTDAILRYLDEAREGPSFTPETATDRARMNMAFGLIDNYGYPNLIQAAAYHLFPDFIGGKDDAAHAAPLSAGETLLKLVMQIKGDAPWIAGEQLSLADMLLGPILSYSALTPDWDRLSAVPGVADWWARMSVHPTFKETAPDLG
ncbi:MAG: glutathione S-transferase family protein [Pikeienuella sp.]